MNGPRVLLRLVRDIADPEMRALALDEFCRRYDPTREERLKNLKYKRQRRYKEKHNRSKEK